jgi:hypothetical protein
MSPQGAEVTRSWVARVRALIGLKQTLPQSLSQMFQRIVSRIGASNPADTSASRRAPAFLLRTRNRIAHMAAQCCNGRLRRGHPSRGFRPCLVRMAVSGRARLASSRTAHFMPVAARASKPRKPETFLHKKKSEAARRRLHNFPHRSQYGGPILSSTLPG